MTVSGTGVPFQVAARRSGSSTRSPPSSRARRRPAGPRRARAAEQHLDARHQLAHRERLAQVVVGADLEAEHAIELLLARGHEDDRQRSERARSRRQSSSPSSRGSRCRGSRGRASAPASASQAVSPSSKPSAACPSRRSATQMPSRIVSSSSTTAMVRLAGCHRLQSTARLPPARMPLFGHNLPPKLSSAVLARPGRAL